MRQELRNDDAGRYLITTAIGSEYVVDLTARTVSCQMAATELCQELLTESIAGRRHPSCAGFSHPHGEDHQRSGRGGLLATGSSPRTQPLANHLWSHR